MFFNKMKITAKKEELAILEKKVEKKKEQISKLESEYKEKELKLKDKLAKLQDKHEDEFNSQRRAMMIISNEIEELKVEKEKLENSLYELMEELEEEREVMEFVTTYKNYEWKHDLANSSLYKDKIKALNKEQKQFIKDYLKQYKEDCNITFNGSLVKGKSSSTAIVKLGIKSYEYEVNCLIDSVKYNNFYKVWDKIQKVKVDIDKLLKAAMTSTEIPQEYEKMKIKELELYHECQVRIAEEKEEQRRIKERIREEEKVLKEIENAKKKIEKEETHFNNAIESLLERMKNENEIEKMKLQSKIDELRLKLIQLAEEKKNVLDRENNNKAGYVYIISNVGSFGENVYKIGTTRRLDPYIRVDELGNASVPFKFDVHAMIFSEDAFELEHKLHRHFDEQRVNKVNKRKEFFNVTLEEIKEVVESNFDRTVEFTMKAHAFEYRKSIA